MLVHCHISTEGSDMGYQVIADVSGYTQLLTDSELENGNGIIADPLKLTFDATAALLTLSGIEGDATAIPTSITATSFSCISSATETTAIHRDLRKG
jgi:hypothetical protein